MAQYTIFSLPPISVYIPLGKCFGHRVDVASSCPNFSFHARDHFSHHHHGGAHSCIFPPVETSILLKGSMKLS